MVKNPILTGFYPDPSICRAEDRYYLVTSTFAYFPGVPIFESQDLASWRQLGSVLNRDSQLPLTGCAHSDGIFAPTIRYHNGTFYMITTLMQAGKNFIVTAKNPAGPWSEPYDLGEAAQGIDPSLFFDQDGTCWYIGQRQRKGAEYNGDCEIWIQQLDLDNMSLIGEPVPVLSGFQKHAIWPEGPHLYRRGEYYYILHAEGGTAFHHSVMAARSRNLLGPYEYDRCNPILTHRHLGEKYPITCVGHGDLVEDGHDNWYMVLLACRPQDGFTIMGRETFLAKVTWEDGWPVINAGAGRLEDTVDIPGTPAVPCGNQKTGNGLQAYSFDSVSLPPDFMTLRNHREQVLSLTVNPGFLRLFMRPDTLKDPGEPAYLCIRQQHRDFKAETVLCPHFTDETGCAGMAMMQNSENQIRVECFQEGGRLKIHAVQTAEGKEKLLGAAELPPSEEIGLSLAVQGLEAEIRFLTNSGTPALLLAENIDLRPLSTERAGGFVGCTVGMYASGNGSDTGGWADFSAFTYQPL